jgi:hypothetical protein
VPKWHNKKRIKAQKLSPFTDGTFNTDTWVETGELQTFSVYARVSSLLQRHGMQFSNSLFTADGTALLTNLANCSAKKDRGEAKELYELVKYPLLQWLGDNHPTSVLVDTQSKRGIRPVLYVMTEIGQVSFHIPPAVLEAGLVDVSNFKRGKVNWTKLYMQEHAAELVQWYLRLKESHKHPNRVRNLFKAWKKKLKRKARKRRDNDASLYNE